VSSENEEVAVDTEQSPATDVPPPTGDSDLTDEEGVSQRLRLKAIHKAHDHAADARLQVKQALAYGELDRRDARDVFRAAVETYLMEIEPLLLGYLDDVDDEDNPLTPRARDLWLHANLGAMTVEPPDRLRQVANTDQTRRAAGASGPSAKRVSVSGLNQVLEMPSPLSIEWQTVARQGAGTHQQHRASRDVQLSLDVLDQAFRRANELLAELGGWADLTEGRPFSEFDWGLDDDA
jgi:hypothetical protein